MRGLRKAGLSPRALARAGRRIAGAAALTALPAAAWAAAFKQVPGISKDEGDDPDMILGLVHANTLFFIALGIFCVFWFVFGGGRKAKIGRKGP